jgi:hydroxymethylbilane synthase
MLPTVSVVRLGTRGSALARWQVDYVQRLLHQAWPDLQTDVQTLTTRGDRVLDTPLPRVGGKGLFTSELEAALYGRTIDLAVHSLKDLPTNLSAGLVIGAVPPRAMPHDVLVSRHGDTLASLPVGATVGTSSHRRAAQLLYQRPDLQILDIRGNVDTRIRKVMDRNGPYDAIILAQAGLERLGQLDRVSQVLSLEQILPAPGQGALGIQCRDEAAMLALLGVLNQPETEAAVEAERAFLACLGGGCAVPVAAYASIADGTLHLRGRVLARDGSVCIDVCNKVELSKAVIANRHVACQLGRALAQVAIEQGAAELLEVAT